MKRDWKTKLSSRKFWCAVAAFITSVLIYKGTDPNTLDSVTSIIMSGGALIAYIVAEGFADGNGK